MKILIDIGHPAHVHYFKNMIRKLRGLGHQVIVVAREKEMTHNLLRAYNISYISRGKGSDNMLGKFLYLFRGAYKIYQIARKYEIDMYLSFASPYNAIASILHRKPNITLDDTEHNILNHKIYVPLSATILTPVDFKREFGHKHIKFRATMDAAYLHPKYYSTPESNYTSWLTKPGDPKKIVILRLVSWNASHDINEQGVGIDNVYRLLEKLTDYSHIYISSEEKLPPDLDKYSIRIKPEEMHYFMQSADLFIGESGSMATESAYLGTHSIVLNSAAPNFGVFQRMSKYKTFYIAKDFNDLLNMAIIILKKDGLKEEGRIISTKIVKDFINLTDFMTWFIINYPRSVSVMKTNSAYQDRFK
jgi:uncharacterized protein